MRVHTLVLAVATAAFPLLVRQAAAQSAAGRIDADGAPRVERVVAPTVTPPAVDTRGALGLTLTASGNERDTLGLLVATVVPDGPADRAGIDVGSRVADIDGMSLRADPDAVADRSGGDVVLRRLARAVRAVQPGGDVTLRVFRDGRFRNFVLQSADAATAPSPAPLQRSATRPALADDEVAAPTAASSGGTLADVAQSMTAMQTQLRRLERSDAPAGLADSIAQIEQDLGALRRRLVAAQALSRRRSSVSAAAASADDGGESLPGLRLSAVSDELSSYFGDGSESGLLVLQADPSWEPIRTGDVILRVDGEPADAGRLRDAVRGRYRSRIDVLRRRRPLTITLAPRD